MELKPGITLSLMDHATSVATLPVSWCFTKEMIEELADYPKSSKITVIICAHPIEDDIDDCSLKETRTICKATDSVAFISFNRPGKHRIYAIATVLPGLDFVQKRVGNRWYFTWLIQDSNGDIVPNGGQYKCADYIDVDIPDGCFAPEPPAWEKNWVNYFFRDKSIDQCQYRRRRILAYTVQPIALGFVCLLFFIIRALWFLLLKLTLLKDVKFWPVFDNIWSGEFRNILDSKDIEYSPDNIKSHLDFMVPTQLGVLVPWVLYITIGLTVFVSPVCASIPFVLLGVLVVGFGLSMLIQSIAEGRFRGLGQGISNIILGILDWVLPYRTPEQVKQDMTKQFVDCEEVSAKPIRTFKDLPKGKRTLKVRFLELKAKVCRPFAF